MNDATLRVFTKELEEILIGISKQFFRIEGMLTQLLHEPDLPKVDLLEESIQINARFVCVKTGCKYRLIDIERHKIALLDCCNGHVIRSTNVVNKNKITIVEFTRLVTETGLLLKPDIEGGKTHG